MLDNLHKYEIILASNSPRRKDLLSRLGIEFKIMTLFGIDESYPKGLSAEDIALHIASKKAEAYKHLINDNKLIITADTIVIVDDKVLGKPHDAEEAAQMLRSLSGREHTVVTAVTLSTKDKTMKEAVTTKVTFAPLSEEEIDFYIVNYLPFDKAGGYGIQEWIGLVAVERIEGSFFNVIGLPVQRLYKMLQSL